MKLAEIQRGMGEAIMAPLTDRWRMNQDSKPQAEAIIRPNSRLSSLERLEIYNRQYWFRLLDCLYDDFPGLRAVVGEKRFLALRKAYLTKFPSRSYSLRNLGSKLEQFLEEEPEWLGTRVLAGQDIAKFEWAKIVAFDSEVKPRVSLQALAGADPNKLELGLQPYISLLDLHYPFDEFSIALSQSGRESSEASGSLKEREASVRAHKLPKRRRTLVAVHRLELDLFYKRLEPGAFELLKAISRGETLGVACAAAIERLPKKVRNRDGGAATIQEWIKVFAQLGWFCER